MTLVRPNAIVEIDGKELTAAEAALVRLRIEAAPGSHDAAQLTLWPRSKFADAAPGAAISIQLGPAGDETEVWGGEVTAAHAEPEVVMIEGLASTAALSRKRHAQTYVGQTIADIVGELAGDVPTDEIESDVGLAAYGVDGRRSVWTHLNDLARLAGADLGNAPDGSLRFVPVREGPATLTLRYGADLLAWSFGRSGAPEVELVAAHGAGSEAGSSRWHWLRNDPFGSGASGTVVAPFGTKDAAEALAGSRESRAARRARRGWLRIVGNAKIRVGALLSIDGLPTADPGILGAAQIGGALAGVDPEMLRVIGVCHELDMASGFVTTLTVEGGAGGLGFGL